MYFPIKRRAYRPTLFVRYVQLFLAEIQTTSVKTSLVTCRLGTSTLGHHRTKFELTTSSLCPRTAVRISGTTSLQASKIFPVLHLCARSVRPPSGRTTLPPSARPPISPTKAVCYRTSFVNYVSQLQHNIPLQKLRLHIPLPNRSLQNASGQRRLFLSGPAGLRDESRGPTATTDQC